MTEPCECKICIDLGCVFHMKKHERELLSALKAEMEEKIKSMRCEQHEIPEHTVKIDAGCSISVDELRDFLNQIWKRRGL